MVKIDSETFKLKTPVQVADVVKDYPDHDLIEWEAVRRFGIRAEPLEHHQELKLKTPYFLVELPKLLKDSTPRRVGSGIHMSVKDRLETLMLSRRSASDLSAVKPKTTMINEGSEGAMRVKMVLPKAQVEKLVGKGKDAAEAAEKIMEFCVENNGSSFHGVALKGNGGLMVSQAANKFK